MRMQFAPHWQHLSADTPVRCDNCDWKGEIAEADTIDSAEGRIDVGGEVPAGECPACGALVYLVPTTASLKKKILDAVEAFFVNEGADIATFAWNEQTFQQRVEAWVEHALDQLGSELERPD
jgi:hypothetical protein